MLLGSFGFLSRLHGLSIDNLVEAEVILIDGRIVIVNEREHEGEHPVPPAVLQARTYEKNGDLWWGLRSSSPALCITTCYRHKHIPWFPCPYWSSSAPSVSFNFHLIFL